MPDFLTCTCREAQLYFVGCCCEAAAEYEAFLDARAEYDAEQAYIEAARSPGSRFEFSKDLDDDIPF
jgi:hypothetical protein